MECVLSGTRERESGNIWWCNYFYIFFNYNFFFILRKCNQQNNMHAIKPCSKLIISKYIRICWRIFAKICLSYLLYWWRLTGALNSFAHLMFLSLSLYPALTHTRSHFPYVVVFSSFHSLLFLFGLKKSFVLHLTAHECRLFLYSCDPTSKNFAWANSFGIWIKH